MRKIAIDISRLFHPLFLPVLAFILFSLALNIFTLYSLNQILIIFTALIVVTVGLPIGVILFLKWVGLISHYELNDRSERIIPLIISAIFIWGASELLLKINFPVSLVVFYRIAVILLFTATFITLFWKISMHALGWGILTAISFILFGLQDGLIFIIFPLVLLISGIVASARLYLGAHSPTQIYCGYILGVLGMMSGAILQSLFIDIIL